MPRLRNASKVVSKVNSSYLGCFPALPGQHGPQLWGKGFSETK